MLNGREHCYEVIGKMALNRFSSKDWTCVRICECPCARFLLFMPNIRLFDHGMQKSVVSDVCACVCFDWVNEANTNESHTIKYLSERYISHFVFIFKRFGSLRGRIQILKMLLCRFVWPWTSHQNAWSNRVEQRRAAAVRPNHASKTHP